MSNLCKEIFDFLEEKGFDCTCEDMGCSGVIYVTLHGKVTRAVLPLEIYARSEDEAGRYSSSVADHVRCLIQKDILPVMITEDRWRRQNEMMRARLLAHLEVFDQIYARNCEVRRIDKLTAADFLSANHSYGDAACRYRYGLFLKRHTGHVAAGGTETAKYPKGTLVAVATFSNARKWIKGDETIRSYEWTRYASLPGVRLSGGMGKFLNVFIEDVHPDDIMTYADLEWSEGKVYERLGFVLEGVKAPVTFAIDPESWDRHAVKEQNMTSVDPRPYGAPPSRGWHVNSGHCPDLQPIMAKERVFFRNFGSNKYRLKLTDYQ